MPASQQPWLALQGSLELNAWYLEAGTCLRKCVSLNSLPIFGLFLQLQSLRYGPPSVPGGLLCPTVVWHRSHRHPEEHSGPKPQDLYLFGALVGCELAVSEGLVNEISQRPQLLGGIPGMRRPSW